MNLAELREQLNAFHRDRGLAEFRAWGRPHLDPPPPVDAEYADLFRPEAIAAVDAACGGDPWRQGRWSRFIQAGCRRRKQAAERRELAGLLEPGAGGEPVAISDELVAALVQVAAEAGLPAAAASPIPHLPERILARQSLLEACRSQVTAQVEGATQIFPADGYGDLWGVLTGAAGFLRRGDGNVTLSRGLETGTLATHLPGRVWLLYRPEAGMAGFDLFLQAAGEALALAHLPEDLPAEDHWLSGAGGASLYGRLWARRLLQAPWYAVAGVAGERAATLARHARGRLADRLVVLATAAGEGLSGPPAAGWGCLSGWPQEAVMAMRTLCPQPEAATCLHREHMAALLDHHLLRRFGNDWDRSPRAADLLRQLWSAGWARPVHELLSFLGETDPDGEALLEDFY